MSKRISAALALALVLTCACQKGKSDEKRADEESETVLDASEVCEQVIENVYQGLGIKLSAADHARNVRSCTRYLEGVRAQYGETAYRATARCKLRESKRNPRGPHDCAPEKLAGSAGR